MKTLEGDSSSRRNSKFYNLVLIGLCCVVYLFWRNSSNIWIYVVSMDRTLSDAPSGGGDTTPEPPVPPTVSAPPLPPVMPPAASVQQLQTLVVEDLPPPKPDFSAPPPYEVAAKLPTYEEVQREKIRLGEPNNVETHVPIPQTRPTPQSLAFLAIDADSHDPESESGLLGTDFMFFTAFLVAFLFNWIGFLLLMCFCHTIAARYGALSGFGLSLAKWTLIVKHSTDLASRENSWLWWLIMAFGLLIFVRAIIQYLNIKRGWRLLSGTAQERLLFFY